MLWRFRDGAGYNTADLLAYLIDFDYISGGPRSLNLIDLVYEVASKVQAKMGAITDA